MKCVLTIAGSDSIGGAGIQADIKTCSALGVYSMSVITAVTCQNTLGVTAVHTIPADILEKQLDAVFEDIFPDGVKTGMFSTPEAVERTAEKLEKYCAKNIVTDPVMISTSGKELASGETVKALKKYLFPKAAIITPNISEAEYLLKKSIQSEDDLRAASQALYDMYGCAVLCKGGHLNGNDFLATKEGVEKIEGQKTDNPNTHGTGCTLSSAICCYLAKGKTLDISVKLAKQYITGAIKDNLNIGKGRGPLNHMYGTFPENIK